MRTGIHPVLLIPLVRYALLQMPVILRPENMEVPVPAKKSPDSSLAGPGQSRATPARLDTQSGCLQAEQLLSTPSKMIISIQLLRFLAALLVVLTHTRREVGELMPFGDFGVDVFFVISGFIMSFITVNGTEFFLVKRLLRIVPLYWLCTVVLAMIAFGLPSLLNSAEFDARHLLASLFFFPHWSQGTEFKPILLLGWTLNYEMFFYGLFYLAMLMSHRYREYLCSAMLIMAYLLLNIVVDPGKTSPLRFYESPIIFEFVFGMMLAIAYRRWSLFRGTLPLRYAFILVLASASIFVLSSFDISPSVDGPAFRWIVWGGAALMLVIAGLGLEKHFQATSQAVRKTLLLLGELSYPMYLVHIYLIALLSRLLGLADAGAVMLFVVSTALTMVASYTVSRFYDIPIRRYLTRRL